MHDHSPTPWWRSRGDIVLIGDIDDTVAVVQGLRLHHAGAVRYPRAR